MTLLSPFHRINAVKMNKPYLPCRPDIDGLRALAIFGGFLSHTFPILSECVGVYFL